MARKNTPEDVDGRCPGCGLEGPARKIESHTESCPEWAEAVKANRRIDTPAECYLAAHKDDPPPATVIGSGANPPVTGENKPPAPAEDTKTPAEPSTELARDTAKRGPIVANYGALEQEITKGEKAALLARWRFGRGLLAEREANGGKQLPDGRMAEVCRTVGRGERELRYRMTFAEQCPTEESLHAAVQTCGSWFEVREALVTTPKEKRPRATSTGKPKAAPAKSAAEIAAQDAELAKAQEEAAELAADLKETKAQLADHFGTDTAPDVVVTLAPGTVIMEPAQDTIAEPELDSPLPGTPAPPATTATIPAPYNPTGAETVAFADLLPPDDQPPTAAAQAMHCWKVAADAIAQGIAALERVEADGDRAVQAPGLTKLLSAVAVLLGKESADLSAMVDSALAAHRPPADTAPPAEFRPGKGPLP